MEHTAQIKWRDIPAIKWPAFKAVRLHTGQVVEFATREDADRFIERRADMSELWSHADAAAVR